MQTRKGAKKNFATPVASVGKPSKGRWLAFGSWRESIIRCIVGRMCNI